MNTLEPPNDHVKPDKSSISPKSLQKACNKSTLSPAHEPVAEHPLVSTPPIFKPNPRLHATYLTTAPVVTQTGTIKHPRAIRTVSNVVGTVPATLRVSPTLPNANTPPAVPTLHTGGIVAPPVLLNSLPHPLTQGILEAPAIM
jgi:hypothetical protein